MIYSLKYVSHPIERVNQAVYVFLERSIPDGIYNHNLFPEWFQDVLSRSKSSEGNLSFNDKFEVVFNEIQNLDSQRRADLFREFSEGLDIRSLCVDPTKPVIITENYSAALHTALNQLLKDHFYGTSLNTNKTIREKLGVTLRDHYISFKSENNTGRVCPFCGLHEYAILEGESKDDYDHWLYKAKYPLYAVNFSNLIPMCDKCNQTGVKGVADVLHNPITGARRKSFYPYDENMGVKVAVNSFTTTGLLTDSYKEKYPHGYFSLSILPQNINEDEEVETWKEVFKIETRYNSYLSQFYNDLKNEFHDDYLPFQPEVSLDKNLVNLRNVITQFKNSLGNPRRKTCVMINRAYLEFIIKPENAHLLLAFCNINLAI